MSSISAQILGRACASTAMIYAMHQVKIACLGPPQRRQRLAGGPAASHRREAIADGLLDHRRQCRRQYPLQRSGDPDQRGAHRAGARRLRHFLWRACRRHRHHRAAQRGRRQFGPGARRLPERGLHAGAHPILGHAGHARHLQHRVHPARAGRAGPDPARALRSHPQPDDDAARASLLERGMDRGRRRRGAAGARLRAQGGARRRRQASPGRGASDAGAGLAGDAARRASGGDAEIRASRGRPRRA